MGVSSKKLPGSGHVLKREDAIRARSKVLSHVSASILALAFVITIFQFPLDNLVQEKRDQKDPDDRYGVR